jgi:uncharacterized protein YdhG (YjbR/CyaY superfamily)
MTSQDDTSKEAKKKSSKPRKTEQFSDEERAAMKERARELKAEARGKKADGEAEVLAKIDELPEPERALALRLHALVRLHAPTLAPKLWYGMPAWALDGKVVCYFQSAHKFKTRYATFGFSDAAALDDGDLWPTAFALKALGAAEEASVKKILQKAMA